MPRTLKNQIYKKLLILVRKRPKVNLKMGKRYINRQFSEQTLMIMKHIEKLSFTTNQKNAN